MGRFEDFDLGVYTDLWDPKMSKEQCRRCNEQMQIMLYEKRMIRYEHDKSRAAYTHTEPHQEFIDNALEVITTLRMPSNAFTHSGTWHPPQHPILSQHDYNKKIEFILEANRTDYDAYPDRDDSQGDEFIESLIEQRKAIVGSYLSTFMCEKYARQAEICDRERHNISEFHLANTREAERRRRLNN
jgi:hypothetical protein